MSETVTDLPNERWSIVKFVKPTKSKNYYVSDHGRVKSIDKRSDKEKLIKTSPDHRGFYRVSIKVIDGNAGVFVHKEVAKAFVDKPSDEHVYVIHDNLVRSNNHHSNIKWVTEEGWKGYVKDRAKKFGFVKSTKGGYFKLTEGEVAMIKKALTNGKTRKKMIAKRFGVSSTQIKRIERGENWAHVKAAK